MSTYQHYVKDEGFLAYYNDYQRRYADRIAERDKVLLGLIAEATGGKGTLLDIGCSTGNLLLHISRAFPDMTLTGGELAESSLAEARANPELAGIELRTMDMLDLPGAYDCIVANAVTYLFDPPLYERALASVYRTLNPGGTFIDFEWFSPFNQELVITETCLSHPDGLTMHVRSHDLVGRLLTRAGFDDIGFNPFEMPFDLPEPPKDGDTISYTRNTEDGYRLCFRGAINQPWCHMTARKG